MDEDILRILSLKTGLSINYISKEERISSLLSELSGILPDNYILKGGTALNRVYLQKQGVSRFSEDLDIDIISGGSIDSKIKRIKDLMKTLRGFNAGEVRLMHRTLRFNCPYVNEIGHKDVIKLEFYMSHNKFITVKKPEKSLITSPYLPTTPALFNTYSLEDLLARKFITLYNRTEGKDIYDIFYGLDTAYDKNKLLEAIRLLMGFYRIDKPTEEFFPQTRKKLDQAIKKSKYIGNSTNHYIPSKLRPKWFIFIKTLKEKLTNKGL